MRLLLALFTMIFGSAVMGTSAGAQLRSQEPNIYVSQSTEEGTLGKETLQLSGAAFPDIQLVNQSIRTEVQLVADKGGSLVVTVNTMEQFRTVEEIFSKTHLSRPEITSLQLLFVNSSKERIPAEDPKPVDPKPIEDPKPVDPKPIEDPKPADPKPGQPAAGVWHRFGNSLQSKIKAARNGTVLLWDVGMNTIINNPGAVAVVSYGLIANESYSKVINVVQGIDGASPNWILGLTAGLALTVESLINIHPNLAHEVSGKLGGGALSFFRRYGGGGPEMLWRLFGSFIKNTLIKGALFGAFNYVAWKSGAEGLGALNFRELAGLTAIEAGAIAAVWSFISFPLEELSYMVNNAGSKVSEAGKRAFGAFRLATQVVGVGVALRIAELAITRDASTNLGALLNQHPVIPILTSMVAVVVTWATYARQAGIIRISELAGNTVARSLKLQMEKISKSSESIRSLFKKAFVPPPPVLTCEGVFAL